MKTVTADILLVTLIACAATEFEMQGLNIVIIFDESKLMHELNLTYRLQFYSATVDLRVYNNMLLDMIFTTFPIGLKELETRVAGFCTGGFWIQWNFNDSISAETIRKKGVCLAWNENFSDNLDQAFINVENNICGNRTRRNNTKDILVGM